AGRDRRRTALTPLAAPTAATAPAANTPAAAVRPQEPAPPQVEVAAAGAAPRGRVEKWRPASGDSQPASQAAAAAPAFRSGHPPEERAAAHLQGDAPARSRSAPVTLGDGRHIELRAIAFSNVQEVRTATIAIDGGAERIVREGETIGDIEVQLILRDS